MTNDEIKTRLKAGEWPVKELSGLLCIPVDVIEEARDNPVNMLGRLNAVTENVKIGYMTQFEQWGCEAEHLEAVVVTQNGVSKRVQRPVTFRGFGPTLQHAVMAMFVDRGV